MFGQMSDCLSGGALAAIAILLVLYLANGPRWAYIFRKTIYRDADFVRGLFGCLFFMATRFLFNRNVVDTFRSRVKCHPDKDFTVFVGDRGESERITYKQAEDYSNQLSHFLQKRSFIKGQVVAVFLENRLDYTCTWLGLAKIGAISALINTNMRGGSLVRMLELVDAKGVICSKETEEALLKVVNEIDASIKIFNVDKIDEDLAATSPRINYVAKEIREETTDPVKEIQLNLSDPLLYVFTSGTTGLPKAAIVDHTKYLMWSTPLQNFILKTSTTDILYTALPMYHTSGLGFFGAASSMTGLTLVSRKKFSASKFWKDCVDHNVTSAQYIGEIVRYLCNTPPCVEERKHRVKTFVGNGLREDLFETVRKRFGIKIAEIYGSTEGNCSSINFVDQPGAMGFISYFFPFATPHRLIKVDPETEQVVRQSNSLCISCQSGETGELVAPIKKHIPMARFDGYLDKGASSCKVLRDVFRKGDIYFRTGDLMTTDELGFLYFVDRCGDTFRWKGENVSTLEVEGIIRKILGPKTELVVYGVRVPGKEGRACMLALAQDQPIEDLSLFYSHVCEALPPYSVPLFIRYVKHVEKTGTYKVKKNTLQKEGIISDSSWILDRTAKTYKPLTAEMITEIDNGQCDF